LAALPTFRAAWLICGLVFVSALVRFGEAMRIRTPLYYSDEYLYSALARSIASTGLPTLRGHFISFPALLGPYLMAPGWLFGSVGVG
jgi:hypothetical protein